MIRSSHFEIGSLASDIHLRRERTKSDNCLDNSRADVPQLFVGGETTCSERRRLNVTVAVNPSTIQRMKRMSLKTERLCRVGLREGARKSWQKREFPGRQTDTEASRSPLELRSMYSRYLAFVTPGRC